MPNLSLTSHQWPLTNFPQVHVLSMTFHGMEYPFGQFRIKAWDTFEHQYTVYLVYEEVHYTVIIKLQLLKEKAKAILLVGM
ncbi:hypothetical protein HGM15179_003885 [Zosterops borbonicus]|uniref:Uncharacterized protein n=1 Tax=Zosterops borbonicus TaxID=364589 RepID=A0A8K1GT07_9PASS|nr:hypothetical protein HGM15179_003885 [Zosterops borbonicus]